MDKPLTTTLSVRSLLEIDLKKFIEGLNFNKSNAENLETLIKAVTYFRTKITPQYQEFAQKLRARSMLLEEKHKYIVEDLIKLHDNTENMVKRTHRLSEKCELIIKKQLNLLGRAEILIFQAKNRQIILSDAEGQFNSDIAKVKTRMKDFQKDIEAACEKKKALEVQEDQWIVKKDNYYLNEWQIKIIRDNLFFMGEEIEHILNKLISLGVELNDHEIEFLHDDV